MKHWTLLTSMAVAGLAAVAMAKVNYVADFASTYGTKKTSVIGKAKCAVCHVGQTAKLNPYGKDLGEAMKMEKTKVLTGSVLKKVEGLDSDKDLKSNLEEIRADTLPGDPKSK
jgi:mono/diheme cytochrome c family protein